MLSSFLVFFSLLCAGFFLFWFYGCMSVVVGLNILNYHWGAFEFFFKLDGLSLVFLFMLVCCGVIALVYCCHYFGGMRAAYGLFYLMLFFLGVMSFLVLSGKFLLTLIFWEYLGFVSFLLILYYSKSVSLRAAVVTLISSRFGDVALFGVLGWFYGLYKYSIFLFSFFLVLVILTKSASFPFISWLMEAMRAPTPVSSLVHSSTLVAAGVWFLLRYNWVLEDFTLWVLFLSCCVTILISGFCACSYVDLKKMVAFSTCKKISWCVVFFIMGDVTLSLFQLLVHGLSKCFLFMVVGDLMSSSDSSQDWGSMYSGVKQGYYMGFMSSFLVLCLSGLPFMGVFFTKHYYFCCCLYSYSVLGIIFIFFGFFLTLVYSIRFVFLLLGDYGGLCWSLLKGFYLLCFLMFLSTFVSFFLSCFLEEVWVSSFFWSIFLIVLQVLGVWVGWLLYSGVGYRLLGLVGFDLGGCDVFVSCFYSFYSALSWYFMLSNFRWEVYFLKSSTGSGYYHLGKFYASSTGIGWVVFGVCCVFATLMFLV